MHIYNDKKSYIIYKIPTYFSAKTQNSGSPKYEGMQVPAQCARYYNNNMLNMLELYNNEIIDLRIDVRWSS